MHGVAAVPNTFFGIWRIGKHTFRVFWFCMHKSSMLSTIRRVLGGQHWHRSRNINFDTSNQLFHVTWVVTVQNGSEPGSFQMCEIRVGQNGVWSSQWNRLKVPRTPRRVCPITVMEIIVHYHMCDNHTQCCCSNYSERSWSPLDLRSGDLRKVKSPPGWFWFNTHKLITYLNTTLY